LDATAYRPAGRVLFWIVGLLRNFYPIIQCPMYVAYNCVLCTILAFYGNRTYWKNKTPIPVYVLASYAGSRLFLTIQDDQDKMMLQGTVYIAVSIIVEQVL